MENPKVSDEDFPTNPPIHSPHNFPDTRDPQRSGESKGPPSPKSEGAGMARLWRGGGPGEPGYSQNGIVDLYSFIVSLLDVNVIMYMCIYIYI